MDMISKCMVSNLYTMGVSAKHDKRQAIPDKPMLPNIEVRELRAKLILEEAFETIKALGVGVYVDIDGIENQVEFNKLSLIAGKHTLCDSDFEEAIDGCCDLVYVTVGTLAAMGVSDAPHQNEVDRANNSKFPNGQATFNESGKFLKPEGWKPPDHYAAMSRYADPNGILDPGDMDRETHDSGGIQFPTLKDLQNQILENPKDWL